MSKLASFGDGANSGSLSKTMAEQVGLTASRVEKLIDVYSFMVQHEDTSVDNWSYYFHVLHKS